MLKGSGRSFGEFNLAEALDACREYISLRVAGTRGVRGEGGVGEIGGFSEGDECVL